jgi:hypothetical protein
MTLLRQYIFILAMWVSSVDIRSELSQYKRERKMKQVFYCSELSDLKFYVRFEVITVVSMNVTAARYVTIWGQIEIDQNLGQTCCVHLQCKTSSIQYLLHYPVVTALFYMLICVEECIHEVLHYVVFCNLLAVSPLRLQIKLLFVPFIRYLGCWNLVSYLRIFWSDRGSDVGRVYRYGLGGPENKSRWGIDFPTCLDRPWGPPCLLYKGYRVFCTVKRPEHGVDHPSPSSIEFQEIVELYLSCYRVNFS